MTTSEPKIALIIPSWRGTTAKLHTSIARQTRHPQEIAEVVGVSPNGLARNQGVSRTMGDLLVFVDDDAVLGHERVVENIIAPLLADSSIGVAGASKLLPPDASSWQRRVAREVPRIEHPVVNTLQETNPDPPFYYCDITTTCCAMRRDVFEQTGGFSETLIRGVDTEFFLRVRRLGYRLVLVPDTWTYHPAPDSLRGLLRKHFLYGLGHSQEVRKEPARAQGRFLHTPLHAAAYLIARTLFLVPNIFLPYSFAAPSWQFGFKPLKAITSYVAALGYVWGWYTAPRAP